MTVASSFSWGNLSKTLVVVSLVNGSKGVVDNGGSVVDDGSGVVGRSQGNRAGVDGMTNSSMTVASSFSRGNLSKTLVVVSLVNGSMAGTESLGDLNVTDLTISLGDRLVAGLTGIAVGRGGMVGVGGSSDGCGEKSGGAQESLHFSETEQ